MKAKLREKYAGMSQEQLMEQAYDLGSRFEQNNQSCSSFLCASASPRSNLSMPPQRIPVVGRVIRRRSVLPVPAARRYVTGQG